MLCMYAAAVMLGIRPIHTLTRCHITVWTVSVVSCHGLPLRCRFGGTVRHYRLYFDGNDHYVGKHTI